GAAAGRTAGGRAGAGGGAPRAGAGGDGQRAARLLRGDGAPGGGAAGAGARGRGRAEPGRDGRPVGGVAAAGARGAGGAVRGRPAGEAGGGDPAGEPVQRSAKCKVKPGATAFPRRATASAWRRLLLLHFSLGNALPLSPRLLLVRGARRGAGGGRA